MIVVFGSINYDLSFAVRDLPRAGETVLAPAALGAPGGKGANQALAARRAGAEVAMVGAVGRDAWAAPALAGLEAAGVDLSAVAALDHATGLAAIAVDAAGRNQIVVGSGANAGAEAGMIPQSWLGPGTILLVQMELAEAPTAAAVAHAKRAGARVMLNLAPFRPLPEAGLAAADILLANEGELHALAPGAPEAAVRALSDRLGNVVVATLGAEGAVLATPRDSYRIGSLAVEAVDTTGAGDAFAGALAAARDRGEDWPAALRYAATAGALACTGRGAQASLPTHAEIMRNLPRLSPASTCQSQ